MGILREQRRALRDDGTLWLNLGDCYAGSWGNYAPGGIKNVQREQTEEGRHWDRRAYADTKFRPPTANIPKKRFASKVWPREHDPHKRVSGKASFRRDRWPREDDPHKSAPGLKAKDLVGIPWRVAFALQADGWWLRADIVWNKPNPMPESVLDRPTKSHEYIFLLSKGQWKSRVVEFADLPGERFHFGLDLGLHPSDVGGCEVAVGLATAIFDFTQRQNDFGLPPFYAKEWKECLDGGGCDLVRRLPVEHGPAAWAARLLSADCTAKEFLCELRRRGIALTDRDQFLVGGCPSEFPLPPGVYRDGEGTVAIHHSGEICKVDFVHGLIIEQHAVGCKYYYDADAVRERWADDRMGASKNKDRAVDHRIHIGGKTRPSEAPQTEGRNRRSVWDAPEEAPERPPPKNSGKRKAKEGAAYYVAHRSSVPGGQDLRENPDGSRNYRSVWTIPTVPFPGPHFATFPPKLAKLCVLAGCPEGGVVLDPFIGSGTVGQVCQDLGRRWIGFDLDEENADLIKKRTAQTGLFGRTP